MNRRGGGQWRNHGVTSVPFFLPLYFLSTSHCLLTPFLSLPQAEWGPCEGPSALVGTSQVGAA